MKTRARKIIRRKRNRERRYTPKKKEKTIQHKETENKDDHLGNQYGCTT